LASVRNSPTFGSLFWSFVFRA